MTAEKIVRPRISDEALDDLCRAERNQVHSEFLRRSFGKQETMNVLLRSELAQCRVWERLNAETMKRLSTTLMDARLLCSCCAKEFSAIEAFRIGPGNYVCPGCVAEVEERDREEAKEGVTV
jgi:hypothetical protein